MSATELIEANSGSEIQSFSRGGCWMFVYKELPSWILKTVRVKAARKEQTKSVHANLPQNPYIPEFKYPKASEEVCTAKWSQSGFVASVVVERCDWKQGSFQVMLFICYLTIKNFSCLWWVICNCVYLYTHTDRCASRGFSRSIGFFICALFFIAVSGILRRT